MQSIARLLAIPVPERKTISVHWSHPETGDEFTFDFVASNDAERMIESIAIDPDKANALALSFSDVIKKRGIENAVVSPELIPMIKIVHGALAEPKPSEADLAFIAKVYGDLFLKMLDAASSSGGALEMAKSYMERESGNSSAASGGEDSNSTSGHTEPRAKSRRR